jgi:hypothetical protein
MSSKKVVFVLATVRNFRRSSDDSYSDISAEHAYIKPTPYAELHHTA